MAIANDIQLGPRGGAIQMDQGLTGPTATRPLAQRLRAARIVWIFDLLVIFSGLAGTELALEREGGDRSRPQEVIRTTRSARRGH